jgi:hypothetical protein
MAPWIKNSRTLTREEVAQILEDFLEGSRGSPYSWDGFTLGMSFEDESLEAIRIRCAGLSEEFPPDNEKKYCNEQGLNVMRDYIRRLRSCS